MDDALSARYGDLLTGSYDCVDRIVLNAYLQFALLAGRLSNVVAPAVWLRRASRQHAPDADGRPVRPPGPWDGPRPTTSRSSTVKAGERKHLIAEEYLATHTVGVGVFLVLVARAPATVWKVTRSTLRGDRQLGEEARVRQPLLVPHPRPGVGARRRSRCPGTHPSVRR